MNLRIDVFLALATVVTADGVITDEERAGLLHAAHAAGLGPDEIAALEQALGSQAGVITAAGAASSDWTETLTIEERVFVYSAALWLAGVDGVITDDEIVTVKRLGDQFGLSEDDRAIANLAAASFTSDRRDVLGLARAIATHGQYF